MHRKLTITVSEDVYQSLHRYIGRAQISSFVDEIIRSHLIDDTPLEAAYREMAADEEREREALEWIEAARSE